MMPLINESHDYLPYIDSDITPETRAQITKLISSELPPDHSTKIHPSIPPLPPSKFSEIWEKEIERKAAGKPIEGGIDTSRYEILDPPTKEDGDEEANTEQWKDILQKSYSSSTHLRTRLTNLALLEEFGKNAWLISNSQSEVILRDLEKELEETKEQVRLLENERQSAQESVRGEMLGLEDAWKKGIRRLIEVEAAAEDVRQQILERRRQGAQ